MRIGGGVPVVLFLGDDAQLPAIGHGCLDCAYLLRLIKGPLPRDPVSFRGLQIFVQMANHVMDLHIIKRQDTDTQSRFLDALEHLRKGECSKKDADYLMLLHLDHDSYTEEERSYIQSKSMYVFANKAARDDYNDYKLFVTHSKNCPVAKIKAKNESLKARSSHFHVDNSLPFCLTICVGAMVALCGRNLYPEWGLYTGAMGTVQEIVFEPSQSPNQGDLPKYVLVDFPSYSGPPLPGAISPTLVPITPIEVGCDRKGCTSCKRKQIPLRLAFARTAHTSQGLTVGKSKPGQPPYPIQSIICDPGTLLFESRATGLLYTMLSRATNGMIGMDRTSSAIYFHGPNMNSKRILNVALRDDGKPFKQVQQKRAWMQHLKGNTRQFHLSPQETSLVERWSSTLVP